uniref:Uncharacterized protein n=1 Tax=Arundo donax TaxID=35708 RepID=A0A0A8ZD04_ARUDO
MANSSALFTREYSLNNTFNDLFLQLCHAHQNQCPLAP